MITIKAPKVIAKNGKARMSADIVVDDNVSSLWFEVEERYGSYLAPERSDAYVLAFLLYAMRHGHDITAESPMTDRLYAQLVEQFLPAFYKANEGQCHPVKIMCDKAPEIERLDDAVRVGTGVSCGVDSMHVFAAHPDITHGCIWNGHGVNTGETKEQRDSAWRDLISQAERFSKAAGVELIIGDSNFDRGCIDGLCWDGMTTYGNLFHVFAMQKFWSKYYIASLCASDNFGFRVSPEEDPAHYEFFLFPFVSLPHMMIQMDGADKRRVEKVADLVKYPLAKTYLNTCWGLHEGHNNCSYQCPKCMRTMLDLYCHNALDAFNAVYDVEYFHNNFHQYLAEYYRGCIQHNFFYTEMSPYIRKKHVSIIAKMRAVWIVLKKATRKICRLGKTNSRFRPD